MIEDQVKELYLVNKARPEVNTNDDVARQALQSLHLEEHIKPLIKEIVDRLDMLDDKSRPAVFVKNMHEDSQVFHAVLIGPPNAPTSWRSSCGWEFGMLPHKLYKDLPIGSSTCGSKACKKMLPQLEAVESSSSASSSSSSS